MKAFRIFPDGMRLDDVPMPQPREGEVLLRVAGAGACHSDLLVESLATAGKLMWTLPFTLGHEITGWVEALGDGVSGVAPGDAVAVYCAWGCGICDNCRRGSENYCSSSGMRGPGLGLEGAMASHVIVPNARYLVPIGDLDPRDVAPLADAGITAYHAISRARDLLVPSATAVVIGAGGLGHLAIQIVKAICASRVIVIESNPAKLEGARALGADEVVLAGDDAVKTVRELNGRRGVDAIFDFVGVQSTMDFARKAVRPDGAITIVGLGGGTMPVRQEAIPYGVRVMMTFYGTLADLRETIALARAGKIKAHVTRYPLEHASDAFTAMRAGALDGRAVICPNG
ncbi:MAG TPA: NAD(P)-dependent alcohol dehydrogenase [Candidatus Acidoferrales bacterium]|nr:NAD(P)-dependent alcohol dehydrogenase [Candidatus Acidoferrales bacterium]